MATKTKCNVFEGCQKEAIYSWMGNHYCKEHAVLLKTQPIKRINGKLQRNGLCTCGSGLKSKKCCGKQMDHTARHYYNTAIPKPLKHL